MERARFDDLAAGKSALEADVKIVSTIPDWNASTQLRINSGVEIAEPAKWSALVDTFRRKDELVEQERRAGRRPRGFVTAARAVGGRYPLKGDWRAPEESELRRLLGVTGETDLHSTIQLFQAPPDVIDLAARLSEPHLLEGRYEFDDGLMDIGAESLGDLIAMFDRWLAENILTHEGWAMFNIRAGLPGRTFASGWLGLHIDLYGPIVGDQLRQTYNGSRIVLNLGDETRHIVFINLRLATMIQRRPELLTLPRFHGALSAAMTERGAQGMIANAFMEAYSDYPVVRLTIEPGQGYIAPTPAFPHDGYLSGKRGFDLILLASHKGDQDGARWRPPDYLASWKTLCAEAARMAH